METMKQIIPNNKLQETIGELIKMLTYFTMREKGIQLQEKFQLFLQKVKSSLELFSPILLPPSSQQESNVIISQEHKSITPNFSQIDWSFRW